MRFQSLPNAGILVGGKFDGHVFDVQLITLGKKSVPNSLYKLTCEGQEHWYQVEDQDKEGRWVYRECRPLNPQPPMEQGS